MISLYQNHRRCAFILALIFVFSWGYGHAIAAQGEWTVFLTVSTPSPTVPGGVVFNALSAGVRNGATDGYDSAMDTVSLLGPADPVQAHFSHGVVVLDTNNDGIIDGWGCPNPEEGYNTYECSLWRDFRALSEEKVWGMEVVSPVNGATITLNMRIDGDPADLAKMEIVLADLSVSSPLSLPMGPGQSLNYQYTNIFEPGKGYGIRRFEVRMKTTGLFITLPTLPDATMGTSYNTRLSAVGGAPVWSLDSGELPPGMSINAYTGEVTGTPTATGSYRFTIKGYDPVTGNTTLREYTLNINSIPKIAITALPDGILGMDYKAGITVAGGSMPLVWSIKGNLPEGLTLDSRRGILSGKLLLPGIYRFTAAIKDANGATDSVDLRITVAEPSDTKPPDPISDLKVLYLSDTSALLEWSAPSDDSMTHAAALYDLRYLEGCPGTLTLSDSTWDKAIEATGKPRPQAGALQTYTLTGLQSGKTYCIAIESRDAAGHVSAMSNIVTIPPSSGTAVSGPSGATSSLILKRGYNLISFPLIPVPNGREMLFGPVLGSPVALYRWYSAYPGITPPQYYLEDTVMPGAGYLLYAPADARIDVSGLSLTDGKYAVALQPGWNMIGTPYDKAILLSSVSVRNNATQEEKGYVDAVKNGWIGNTLYYIEGGNYDFVSFDDDPPAALEPWVGYWIYVGSQGGVEIILGRP